jgi:magnesium-protoporphyrin IX monomethyl ester (oxidative) cyclase
MEKLIVLNKKLIAVGASDAPGWLKILQKAPLVERFAAELLQLFLGKTIESGSVDFIQNEAAIVY